MSSENEKELPLDHPEITELFQDLLTTLVSESDRGAVLVGAAHIDEHLRRFFEVVLPSDLGKNKRESLLDYPGPLSSFAARIEVAYATRLISRSLYDSLQALRRIRNEVAHHPISFSLREQAERVRKMYAIGSGVPVEVNRRALDIMMYIKMNHVVRTVRHPTEDRPYFSTTQEAMEYLSEKPEIIDKLDEQLPRYELAVGIVFVCALIVWHREAALHVLGTDGSLANLRRKTSRVDKADGEAEDES